MTYCSEESKRAREKTLALLAQNRCVWCRLPRRDGDNRSRYYCPSCKERNSVTKRSYRQFLLSEGRCIDCGKVRDRADRTCCLECRGKYAARNKRNKKVRRKVVPKFERVEVKDFQDHLDGKPLLDGERVIVRWGDGTTSSHTVKCVTVKAWTGLDGEDQPTFFSDVRASVGLKYKGLELKIPLRDSELQLVRDA